MASNNTRSRSRVELSMGHLWAITVMAGVFAFVNTHPIRPHDFWWHLKAGELIASTGRIPTVDTFSFLAAGRPYPYTSYWLMETLLYRLYALGKAPLVVLATSLSITAAYACILWASRLRSGSWRIAAACTLAAAALGIDNWNVRPQSMVILCFAAIQLALTAYEQRHRWVWLAVPPLAMLIWVNSHGSYPLGWVLLGFWLLESLWQRRRDGTLSWQALRAPALTLTASILAVLANPQGIRALVYPSAILTDPAVRSLVTEWAPTSSATMSGKLFLAALFGTAALLIAAPKRPSLITALMLLGFAMLALSSHRHILWFGLVAAVESASLLATLAARSYPSRNSQLARREHPALNAAIALGLLAAAILSLPWLKAMLPLPPQKAGIISSETPVALAEAMQAARWPQPIFNDETFGSYLIWAASPEVQVFVDPRIDLYSMSEWMDYLAIASARYDWERILDRYGIATLVLSVDRQPALIAAAAASPSWTRVYEDELAVVYSRQPQASLALPRAHSLPFRRMLYG